jgi:hypothetical protein
MNTIVSIPNTMAWIIPQKTLNIRNPACAKTEPGADHEQQDRTGKIFQTTGRRMREFGEL